jgi:hypothetical protein
MEDDGSTSPAPHWYVPIYEYRDVIPTADGGFLAVGSAQRQLWNGSALDYTYPAAVVQHASSGVTDISACFFSPAEGNGLYAIEAHGANYLSVGWGTGGGFYLLKIAAGTPPAPVAGFHTDGEMQYGTVGQLYDLCIDGDWIYAVGASDSGNVLPSPSPILGVHGGLRDAYAAKFNANTGAIEWQTLLGGTSDWDFAYGVTVDPAGGLVAVGLSASTDLAGTLEANHGGNDIYAAKLAANGQLIWQTSLGGSASDSGNSIAPAQGGGFIMAGATKSADLLELIDPVNDTLAAYDFYVAKLY